MGSFNETCTASGLPIFNNDPVYAVVIRKKLESFNPISSCTHSTDHYIPALLPVSGVYDSYGGIEKCKQEWWHDDFLARVNRGMLPFEKPSFMNEVTKLSDPWGKNVPHEPFKDMEDFFNRRNIVNFDGCDHGFVLIRADVYEAYQTMAESLWTKWIESFDEKLAWVKSIIAQNRLAKDRKDCVFVSEWGGSAKGLGSLVGDRYIDTMLSCWHKVFFNMTDEKDGILEEIVKFAKFSSVMSYNDRLWIRYPSGGQGYAVTKEKIAINELHVRMLKEMRSKRLAELGYDGEADEE